MGIDSTVSDLQQSSLDSGWSLLLWFKAVSFILTVESEQRQLAVTQAYGLLIAFQTAIVLATVGVPVAIDCSFSSTQGLSTISYFPSGSTFTTILAAC